MHSILVVDDEPFVRLSIASLRAWGDDGFDFLAEAANGAEALDLLAARPEIDIVLLDLSMPVMDGIEFLRRLQARGARRPPVVVVLSAHGDYHLVREAFKLGASDYLLKSEVDAGALKTVLEKAAAGIAASGEWDAAILQRRHLQALKAQVLRDLVVGPTPPELEETFAGLGITIEPPFAARCSSAKDAAESYRSARAVRTVASRIVVLAKRAIRERFADPDFSLEKASERAGVSKNHLSFEFSRETGETFVEHLSRIRIEEAKRLLATTSLMVYEIGERVGYPNVEHFSRVFKKIVGVSPVRFKAECGTLDPTSS